MGLGKTIQVISFLSAIMRKHGDERDLDRRHSHVSDLQDEKAYRKKGILPKANATWPTCLIIAVSHESTFLASYFHWVVFVQPATVVGNWEREFETWGYFEVGIYNGSKDIRKEVLKDFKMGRLDVGGCSYEIEFTSISSLFA
jgi:SNF2 family DNA or RNA helicase